MRKPLFWICLASALMLSGTGYIQDVILNRGQFVLFAVIGNIADDWSISDLHSNMKWDVEFGLRFMTQKAVFRIDTVVEESWSTWVMVSQPF